MTRLFLPAISLVCAGLLAACGGGGGGGDSTPAPVTDEVPASASATSADMAKWMTGLAASVASADTKEPLDISKFAPPEPDDEEPVSLL
jgi:uncharacterized membrane protein YfcA